MHIERSLQWQETQRVRRIFLLLCERGKVPYRVHGPTARKASGNSDLRSEVTLIKSLESFGDISETHVSNSYAVRRGLCGHSKSQLGRDDCLAKRRYLFLLSYIEDEGRSQGTLFPVVLDDLVPADHLPASRLSYVPMPPAPESGPAKSRKVDLYDYAPAS